MIDQHGQGEGRLGVPALLVHLAQGFEESGLFARLDSDNKGKPVLGIAGFLQQRIDVDRVARQRAQHLRDRSGPDGRRRPDGDLLMAHRRERALVVPDAAGAQSVAVSAPAAVTWLTGYAPDIETGPSPFALSAIAVLAGDVNATLVVSEDEEEGARETGCEVVTYPVLVVHRGEHTPENLLAVYCALWLRRELDASITSSAAPQDV